GSTLYTTNYAYAPGSGCGGCGGGGSPTQVSSRTITDGENSDTIYFIYDLLGRLAAKGVYTDPYDYVYTYSGPNLASVEMSNFTLWGSSTISYARDKYNRI